MEKIYRVAHRKPVNYGVVNVVMKISHNIQTPTILCYASFFIIEIDECHRLEIKKKSNTIRSSPEKRIFSSSTTLSIIYTRETYKCQNVHQRQNFNSKMDFSLNYHMRAKVSRSECI